MDNVRKAVFFKPFDDRDKMTPLRQQQGSELEVWCEVYRSAHRSADELVAELKEGGTIISRGGRSLINRIKLQPLLRVKKYKLIKITVGELGLPDRSTWEDIFKKAISIGLHLCPSWIGYDLCVQKKDLIEPNEVYLIGMFEEAFIKKGFLLCCLSSYSSASRIVKAFEIELDTLFRSDHQFIFVVP